MKKTRIEKINSMKKFADVVVNDSSFFDEEKKDEIWYGGNVVEVYYKDYKLELNAYGETRGIIAYRDKEGVVHIDDFCDKNEDGLVGSLLKEIGVKSDDEFEIIYDNYTDDAQILKDFEDLEKEGKKVLIASSDSNWFELDIYKKNNDKYDLVYDGVDNCCDIDEIIFESKKVLSNYIDDYIGAVGY